MYRNTKNYLNEIIRLANKFIDAGAEEDGEKLLEAAHGIGANTLHGNFPTDTLMGSLQALLNDQGIDFALIGGVAVSLHGLVRNTDDIDVVVSKLPDVSNSDYAGKFGFYRSKSHTGTVLTIDHKKDGFVELLLANSDLLNYALRTAKPMSVLKTVAPVIGADALIGLKIRALVNNPAREHKDGIDIIAIYKKQKPDLTTVRGFLSDAELEKLDRILV